MNLKIIVLLSCMAICTKAVPKVPLTKVLVTSNEPSFDGDTASYVNLIIDVRISYLKEPDYKPFKMTLDTTSDRTWVASENCTSRNCPSIPTSPLPPDGGNVTSIDNNNVNGWENFYKIQIGSMEPNISVVNAYRVSRTLGQKIAKSSNGVLGLNNKYIVNNSVQGIISICTVGPGQGLYLGIPEGITKQTDVANNPRAQINLGNPNAWRIKMNYIRNSLGEWKTWCFAGCSAVIDATFTGIAGPAHDINSINAYIGADDDGNIPCYKANHLEPLYFYIDYNRYKLEAKNYIIKSDDKFNPQCKSAFVVEQGYDNQWRLGMPLFDQYLTIIDYNSNSMTLMELK